MNISFLPEFLHKKNMKIIDRYGLDHQLLQLTEECGELIQAISKLRRAKEEYGKAEIYQAELNVELEMVDIIVLFDQVMSRYGMKADELVHMASYKIDRQLGRMKG